MSAVPAPAPGAAAGPTRRSVVVGVGGVLSLTFLAACTAPAPPALRAGGSWAPNLPLHDTASPTLPLPGLMPSEQPSVVASPDAPINEANQAWAARWSSPIYSIDNFIDRTHASGFSPKAIMLTVDDGPNSTWTPRFLDLFAKYEVRATFNMIGRCVATDPGIAKEVAQHGHVIANHTWSHNEQMRRGSAAYIHGEIARCQDAIHSATGYLPAQFRAPAGNWSPGILAELANQKMMPVDWDIDPRDWSRPGTGAIEKAMLAARPHNIILCHDGGGDRSQTYAALQAVIPAFLERGLTFATLPSPGEALN